MGVALVTTTALGAVGAGIITQAATASAGTITVSSVGSLGAHLGYLASSSDTIKIAPRADGDLVVIAVMNDTWATEVSSVSGGSVGSWKPAGAPFLDGSDGEILQLWYGQATSTQSSSLSVKWRSKVTNADVLVQEFSTSAPAAWSVVSQGISRAPFPSLAAPSNQSNLYFGASMAWGNAAAGGTSGITYSVLNRNTMLAWGLNASGTVAPTGTGAGSLGAVLTATSTGSSSTASSAAPASSSAAPASSSTTPASSSTAPPAASSTTGAAAPTTTAAPSTPISPAFTAPARITEVGVLASKSGHIGSSSYSTTLAPHTDGDLLVMGVINDTWAVSVSSVSGGGVNNWQRAGQPFYDAADGQIMQYWYGTVTSTSASPVQVGFTSSINNIEFVVDELSGATGWTLGTPVSAAHPFPSITSTSSASAYVGMGFAWGNAATGSSSSIDYQHFSSEFITAVAAPATGTIAPAGTGAGSLAVLVNGSVPGAGANVATTTTTAPPTTAAPTTTAQTTTTRAATTTTAPTTTTAAPSGSSSGNSVPPASLMPNSVFNWNAQSWPVASDSTALANDIVAQYKSAYGSVAVNQNRPVYWVPAGQAMVGVGVAPGCSNFQPSAGNSAPIPSNAVAGTSSDHILTVYQPSTGSAWEYWLAQKTSSGWQACSGGKLSLSSSNGVFASPYGETATGIANLATEITEADVQSGSIRHAIAIEVLGNSCDGGYVWPANRDDCSASGTHPQEGDWFRFPANIAMPSGLTPFGQMVFKAIQTYGVVVVDQGGAVGIETDAPSAWSAEGHSGTDPITAAMNGQPEYQVVASLPWGSLQHITPP